MSYIQAGFTVRCGKESVLVWNPRTTDWLGSDGKSWPPCGGTCCQISPSVVQQKESLFFKVILNRNTKPIRSDVIKRTFYTPIFFYLICWNLFTEKNCVAWMFGIFTLFLCFVWSASKQLLLCFLWCVCVCLKGPWFFRINCLAKLNELY